MPQKIIYIDGFPSSERVRVGITETNGGGYSVPDFIELKGDFSVRQERGRNNLRGCILDLLEKEEDLCFLTPRGRLDLEETKKYFGVS